MASTHTHQDKSELPATDARTTVLLVDDQAIVAAAVRRLLADLRDIDLHYCANGADAINQANRIKPSLILQDLVMPSIDGLELVRLYRANPSTAETPIIVLSSEEDPRVKSDAFSLGANDYLVKLPDKIELIARIRSHSQAYINRIQRDEAFRALRESQRQLMDANAELQRLTNVDALTGLQNRRYFDEFMRNEWNRSVEEGTPLSVLLIDVDNFKRYNDTHGHLAGDEVLRKVAESMRNNSRGSGDCVARFGGEEFAVILPSTPLNTAQLLAESYRRGVETLQFLLETSGGGSSVTVSVGGATTIAQRDDHSRL